MSLREEALNACHSGHLNPEIVSMRVVERLFSLTQKAVI